MLKQGLQMPSNCLAKSRLINLYCLPILRSGHQKLVTKLLFSNLLCYLFVVVLGHLETLIRHYNIYLEFFL